MTPLLHLHRIYLPYILIAITFVSTSVLAAAPNGVSYFTASSYNIYSGGSTVLSWGRPSGASGTIYYNFSIQKSNGSKFVKLSNTTSQSFTRTINITGSQTFYVQACNASGECSSESSISVMVSERVVAPGTASTPIPQKSQQPINQNLIVSWGGVANANYYRFYQNGAQIYSGSNQYAYVNNNTPGYRNYTVVACNDGGCGGQSASASVYYYAAPSQVQNLNASMTSQKQNENIVLTWSAPGDAVAGITYQILINGNLKATISSTQYNAVVEKSGSNTYQVIACNPNGAGCSASKSISVTGIGSVSSFTASSSVINSGNTTILKWSMPAGFTGTPYYNLYVDKPNSSSRTKIQSMTGNSFSRLIDLQGIHVFYVQACNASGICGAETSLSVTVNPNQVSSFTASSYKITSGESTQLTWGAPQGFVGTPYYNLFVEKPNSSSRTKIQSMTATSFTRLIDLQGSHAFYVQACDASGICGAEASLSVTVNPNKVSSFTASSYNIKSGESTQLIWSAPQGFVGTPYYNLYVKKPGGSAKSKFESMILGSSFSRLIDLQGIHSFYVQACDVSGVCGAETSLNVAVKPGKVSSFIGTPSEINTGEVTKLKWEAPQGFVGTTYYNLSVNKPDSSSKTKFQSMITAETFDRKIDMNGVHTFFVAACDSTGQCGDEQSTTVKAIGISKVSLFTISKDALVTGESALIKWSKPEGFINTPLYNLYVSKPDGSAKLALLSLVSVEQYSHVFDMTGVHTIHIEACNSSGECGPAISKTVTASIGKVSSFSAMPNTVVAGKIIQLKWTEPSGYLGDAFYNLYVDKPDGAQRSKFKSMTSDISFERTIDMVGSHTFYVEACNVSGVCGAQQPLAVHVTGTGKVSTFSTSKTSLIAGQTTTLTWSAPLNFTGAAFYNLYVDKPDGAQRSKFKSMTSDISFNRTIDMVGSHIFYIEACNVSGVCGPQQSLIVSATGIGKVSTFSTSKTSLIAGQTTTLTWSAPLNFTGAAFYNLYVDKPDGAQRSKFKSMTSDISFERTIDMVGSHTFYVEACNVSGVCGPQQSLTVSVTGIGKVTSFTAIPDNIITGQVTTLSWSLPLSFTGDAYYNLYVDKPDALERLKFDRMTTEIKFDRRINLPGIHTFYVEACDVSGKCGPKKSLLVTVSASGISVFKDIGGSLYLQIPQGLDHKYIKLVKDESNKWSVVELTQAEWNALSLTITGYTIELGDFNLDALSDFRLTSANNNIIITVLKTVSGYQVNEEIKINFLSIDLLGKPIVSNQESQ